MTMEYRDAIFQEFVECVSRTVERLRADDDNHRPFHRALLSDEALFWSRFERSFSTSFGQGVIERISRIAAYAGGADEAVTQKHSLLLIDSAVNLWINNHISSVRDARSGVRGNWEQDLYDMYSIQITGRRHDERVISDLYWFKDGVQNYMSIKTVKPNIDQTAEAKKDLLKLKAANPNANVYFGLYYNPYGNRREEYSWSPPQRIFNFMYDRSVLIGRDYWDTLGGEGFYDELLQIAQDAGEETRGMIRF